MSRRVDRCQVDVCQEGPGTRLEWLSVGASRARQLSHERPMFAGPCPTRRVQGAKPSKATRARAILSEQRKAAAVKFRVARASPRRPRSSRTVPASLSCAAAARLHPPLSRTAGHRSPPFARRLFLQHTPPRLDLLQKRRREKDGRPITTCSPSSSSSSNLLISSCVAAGVRCCNIAAIARGNSVATNRSTVRVDEALSPLRTSAYPGSKATHRRLQYNGLQ